MADFDKAIPDILAHEGGDRYTNRPHDRGGPTKYGITQRTLAASRGHPVTPDEVKALTEPEARVIYRAWYWEKCWCDQIQNQIVATKIFDIAVNLGVMRRGEDAAEILQQAINLCTRPDRVRVDGWIGAETIAGVNECDPIRLLGALCLLQRDYYLELITHDPTQEENRAGWLARADWPHVNVLA